jgi:ribonuclease P protein component
VAEKLRRKSDFQRLYELGNRASTEHAVVIVAGGLTAPTRVAFVAGRKVGKAHDRIRAKRRLREVWRRLEPGLPKPLDVIIIARPSALEAPFPELCAVVQRGIERARAGGRRTGPEPARQGGRARRVRKAAGS